MARDYPIGKSIRQAMHFDGRSRLCRRANCCQNHVRGSTATPPWRVRVSSQSGQPAGAEDLDPSHVTFWRPHWRFRRALISSDTRDRINRPGGSAPHPQKWRKAKWRQADFGAKCAGSRQSDSPVDKIF